MSLRTKAEIVYLSCPFCHSDPLICEERVMKANKFASSLMREGIIVFCPLIHNVSILKYGLPVGWDYWEQFNKAFINKCDRLYVLKLDGWEKSVGVQAEVGIARSLRIPIEYFSLPKLSVIEI